VRLGIADGLAQLVDDVLRGRLVRIAHAEVDDVLAGGPSSSSHGVHFRENVGR